MDGFERHEDKRRQNIDERGVDFRLAARIFASPFVEDVDDRQEYGETRYRALGCVGDDYYVVAYTWRGGNRRLISAWRVGDDGRRRYQALLARRA